MFLSKKIKLYNELEKEKAKIKSLIENNELLSKLLDDIDNMIDYSLINLTSRKLLALSLIKADKYLWEEHQSRIKNPKNLKLRNIRKTLKIIKQLRVQASNSNYSK